MKPRIVFALCSMVLLASLLAFAQGPARHVNQQRLWATLEKLSEFGRPAGAGFEGGVTRVGFSEEDLAARGWLMQQMREAGLEVRVDPAGNIFGKRAGSEKFPTILFGSHIDSVPRGGNFDGDVGSLGALEVMRALRDGKIATRHPLEIVIWTNEEGHHFGRGLLGSSAAAGLLSADVLERRDEEGKTLADWLRRYGQDPARLADARIAPGALAAYLELHIEQGGVLDESKIQIGVVQGIVGIHWWTCTASGFANHAGTTPMNRRQDALAAAARAALAVREEVRAESGRQVGTIGYVRVEPGARNIIPGRVEFPVELRDLDAAKVLRIWARIEKRFAEIAKEENVKLDCVPLQADEPALTDTAIQNDIRAAARAAGYSTLDLPSGAGHDAQQIAKLAPIGMIFVPSRGGISHSPREYSAPADVANGAEVLYRTILLLDERLNRKP
ncbi:MAG: Zn-dependent hydrolase [Acidobacteria bacterium]|nr:Zn-dependent hydrolase [Acidobacteriota bacterium]MCL5287533.1 Zn-dependent hydrolase [Acidobacteriota bacterium]